MTFAAGAALFVVLPFLGGSAPQVPRASVVLAAGDSAAARPAAEGPPSAPAPSSDSLSAMSGAIGGGLFMFPNLTMSPGAVPALSTALSRSVSFIRPVPGPETSPFGPRIHPVMGVPMFHTGLDLGAACATPIRAAASGTVVYAQVSASWGARTIIQHSPSLKTAYGHQSKFLVKEGDVVKQGDIIGLVGTTGWSTGCHLHFDVILDDRYVDPAPYLGLPSSHAPSIPFRAAPHVVSDERGLPVHLVEDGDVPIPSPTTTTSPQSGQTSTPSATTTTPVPTTTAPTTTDPTTTTPPTTTDPTTTDPTTTDPATTTPPTTTDPTTTDPTTTDPATTTPPTTTDPTTTDPTTTDPATTTAQSTTSEPTTSDPTTTTAQSATSEPTTSDPTTTQPTTSDPTTTSSSTSSADTSDPSVTSEPTSTP